MSRVRVFVLAWVLCLGSVPAVAQRGTCSALSQTTFVRDTLDELYYWYRNLPDVDPARAATPEAFLDAESYPGVSLIIAYSPCIAHGVDLSNNLRQQDLAVKSGHWPLLRYDPRLRAQGRNPLSVDSAPPAIPYHEFAQHEARFTVLEHHNPDAAKALMEEAERTARARHRAYTELAALAPAAIPTHEEKPDA